MLSARGVSVLLFHVRSKRSGFDFACVCLLPFNTTSIVFTIERDRDQLSSYQPEHTDFMHETSTSESLPLVSMR
jgi:hypothetical protein